MRRNYRPQSPPACRTRSSRLMGRVRIEPSPRHLCQRASRSSGGLARDSRAEATCPVYPLGPDPASALGAGASCAHPESPTVELPAGISLQSNLPQQSSQQPSADSLLPLLPVVHAGDIVQLRSQEDALRIEVAAIAEQSGALGQPVRVRLMQRATLGQQIEEQFNGVVRGPHDVEMQR